MTSKPSLESYGLQASVDELKIAISKARTKYYPSRQRLTLPAQPGQKSGSPLLDGKPLSEYSLSDGSTIVFKDLGTQVRRAASRLGSGHKKQPHITQKCYRSAGPQFSFGNTLVPWQCIPFSTSFLRYYTLESSEVHQWLSLLHAKCALLFSTLHNLSVELSIVC